MRLPSSIVVIVCSGSPMGDQKVAGLGTESGLRHDDFQRANNGTAEVNIINQVFSAEDFRWTMAVGVEDGGGVPNGDYLVRPTILVPTSFRQLLDIRLEADSVKGDRLIIGGSSVVVHNNGIPRTKVPPSIWNGVDPWASEEEFHLIAFRFTFNTTSAGSFDVYVDPITGGDASARTDSPVLVLTMSLLDVDP